MNSFDLGPYTVKMGLRHDNPALPKFLVFRKDRLIGSQVSYPTRDDCEALEREHRDEHATVRKSRYGRTDKMPTLICENCGARFIARLNYTVYCTPCRPLMKAAA